MAYPKRQVIVDSANPIAVSLTAPATAASALTGTKSNVSGTGSSITVLAANTSAKMRSIFNDSGVTVYLDLTGGTASSTSFTVKLADQDYYEVPKDSQGNPYTGLITGLWASGSVRVTQWV